MPVTFGCLPSCKRNIAGEIRIADVADLALADEIVERAQRLLDRRQRIVIVLLVEIDVVGLQPRQARLDRDMM
jgi:hypothetical protein